MLRPVPPLCLVLAFFTAAGVADELALPRAGDHSLRVLSPTVLELKIVTAHGDADAPLAGVFGEDYRATLPPPETFLVRANGAEIPVKSVGAKRRVLYAPLHANDIRLGNWLYLELAQPLQENARVDVRLRAGRAGPPRLTHSSPLGPPSGAAPETKNSGEPRGTALPALPRETEKNTAPRAANAAETSREMDVAAARGDNSPTATPPAPSSAPLWPEPFTFTATLSPQRESPAIHVNQIGYAPAFQKLALVGYYLGDLGELHVPTKEFELRDTTTSRIVHRGQLTRRADRGFKDSTLPYQDVWQADFSALRTPGEYQLVVPGLGASRPFRIHDGAFMAVARTYALGLYHQRCGAANELPFTRHTHAACHVAPAEIPATAPEFAFTWQLIGKLAAEKRSGATTPPHPFTSDPASQLYPFVNLSPRDVSGGHHDAGDYSKYTANSAALVHHLVLAVDAIAGLAALDNLGLPESGDGVPDLLQIAKWEADFLAKLQDDDGGFYFLVYPRERRYESNALPDAGEPQVVWPKNTAVTAAAVAALAQCASSPHFKKHFPEDAARYLAQARRGWEFLLRALEGGVPSPARTETDTAASPPTTSKHGADGAAPSASHGRSDSSALVPAESPAALDRTRSNLAAYQRLTHYGDNFAHDDEIAWAACELFLATGDEEFQRALFRWMPDPSHARLRRWGWHRLSDSWGNAIRSYAFAARSGRLSRAQLNASFLRLCEGEILAAGDDALARSQASAYGTAFPLETKRYRSGGWYFSLDFAMDMVTAHQLEPRDDFVAALIGNLNYEAGANPLNRVFLTGLGRERQREIVHQFSHNDRRALPPGGIPIGNLIAGQPYHPPSKLPLRLLSYPDDGAASGGYPLYDRWSDVHNVSAEFIVTNQARGLIASAFLASLTPAAQEPWRAAEAKIVLSSAEPKLDEPLTARLEFVSRAHRKVVGAVPVASDSNRDAALDWADADIIWEARDHEPVRGREFTFTPRRGGDHWVEAEAVWPDGRRVFAVLEFDVESPYRALLDDDLPDGAAPSGHAKGWSWHEAGAPQPFSGTRALQTGDGASGTHEFVFPKSSEPLAVGADDVLFAHVWLDPEHPPREIMVSWNDGESWSHRAYWGENILSYGKNDTPAQWRMGDLPRGGVWVRLDVPARTVDLAGKSISGLSLSAVDGRVVWDLIGVRAANAPEPKPRATEPSTAQR